MRLVVAVEGWAATGVGRVEEEVLHVDRYKLFGVGDFVKVRAANDLVVVLLALATASDILLPAGQVEQPWIIAEGEAAFGLAAALIGQANDSGAVALSAAAQDQAALCGGPESGAVVDVGQFVQHSGEHFPAHGAVGTVGLQGGGRTVGQPGQQLAIEVQL